MNKLLTLVLLIILGGYSFAFIIIKSRATKINSQNEEFCQGWQNGIEDAIANNPRTLIYNMPECPLIEQDIAENDYQGGYRMGFKFVVREQLSEN